jgi:uncharacterized membrane protein YoaK (UPF0700 family)
MAPPASRANEVARRAALAAALTWTAGAVDAVGYLRLQGLYVANMSGNSVGVGIHAALGDPLAAWRKATPILGFFVGLVVTAVMLDWAKRRHLKRMLGSVLLVELGLLVLFGALSGAVQAESEGHFYLLVGLLSVAMGMQNSALLHFEALTLYTTHVTGLLTRFAHSVVDAIFWLRDRRRSGEQGPLRLRALWRAPTFRGGLGLAALWFLYVVGALVGAACALRWGGAGVWAACAMLLATVLLEGLAPVRP